MAPVSIKYIVSFSSQDDSHKASNIVSGDGLKKWLSSPTDRSGKIEVVLQLEESCQLAYLDIGTVWCSSLEVRVGRSDWPQTAEFKPLVPRASLMTPVDCRLSRGICVTKMFSKSDFSSETADQRWDRVQIVCGQPFRKDVQFGISFIRLKSANPVSGTEVKQSPLSKPLDGQSRLCKDVSSIQRHFFGKQSPEDSKRATSVAQLKQRLLKISGTTEHGSEQEQSLSRTAKLVLKASENSTAQRATASPVPPKRGLFSGHLAKRHEVSIDDEMKEFFPTLKIKLADLEHLKIVDLRHKFEKKKRRKLTVEEKRTFFRLCERFIYKLLKTSDDPSIAAEYLSPAADKSKAEGSELSTPSKPMSADMKFQPSNSGSGPVGSPKVPAVTNGRNVSSPACGKGKATNGVCPLSSSGVDRLCSAGVDVPVQPKSKVKEGNLVSGNQANGENILDEKRAFTLLCGREKGDNTLSSFSRPSPSILSPPQDRTQGASVKGMRKSYEEAYSSGGRLTIHTLGSAPKRPTSNEEKSRPTKRPRLDLSAKRLQASNSENAGCIENVTILDDLPDISPPLKSDKIKSFDSNNNKAVGKETVVCSANSGITILGVERGSPKTSMGKVYRMYTASKSPVVARQPTPSTTGINTTQSIRSNASSGVKPHRVVPRGRVTPPSSSALVQHLRSGIRSQRQTSTPERDRRPESGPGVWRDISLTPDPSGPQQGASLRGGGAITMARSEKPQVPQAYPSNRPEDGQDVLIFCDKCYGEFPPNEFDDHHPLCLLPAVFEDVTTSRGAALQHEALIDESVDYAECPICLERFPQDVLPVHASECGLS